MFSCIRMRPFLICLKQAYKLYNASSFQCTNDKTDIEKHGTNESHAIDAKKIVFLKDKFIYYSITY